MGNGQPLPYNTSRIALKVKGEALDVIKMKGTEALSCPFRFEVDALIDQFFDMGGCIKSPAQLTFTGIDGVKRTIAGIITNVQEGEPHKEGQLKCRFRLESNLRLLALQTDHRVILGHTLPDIVRNTCERHGITNTNFDLSQSYSVRPYVVQVGETDLEFIQRLLGKSGITFWSCFNPDNPDQEVITFTDHNANCPYIARNVLEFKNPNSLEHTYSSREVHVGLHKLLVKSTQQTDNYAIHDWNNNTPSTNLYATTSVGAYGATQGQPATLKTRFGLGSLALDETERLAKQHAEYARSQSWDCEAHGNVIDMAAGHVFSLDANEFNPEHSGDMIITAVTHHASQAAGLNLDGTEVAYRHEAHCIKRETPYRPAIPNHPEVPMTFTARIESEGKYATLDSLGRYKLRNLFDLSVTEHTQATVPIRKLQPFGGPPSDSVTGMHIPLQDGDEVLLSCLNGDPDRPMIVGSAYTAEKVNPVTAQNKHQNMIKTKADNALIMDDKIDHEAITLRTYEGYNILKFNADVADHKVLLETQHGAITQFAKKTHTTETKKGSIFERSGNERLEIVENKHTTETKEGAIHHQAKTDVIENAYKNIKTKSGQNTEIRAGNNMVFNVEDNATFTIKGSDGFHAKVNNGELTINAAKEISITGKGGGDITFEQQGGGFKIDAAGNVKLYGKNIKLGGQGQVNLIGNVSYDIGGGTIPGAASITAPLKRKEIEKLKDPYGKQVINLAWSQKIIPAGNKLDAMFSVKYFKGGETATITIMEVDMDGSETEVDTRTVELNDGMGHYNIEWQSKVEDAEEDFEELEDVNEIEQKQALSFYFTVKVDGIESEQPSNSLWVTRPMDITIEPDDENPDLIQEPTPDGTIVKIKMINGRSLFSETKNQVAHFPEVIIGPILDLQVVDYKHRIDK